MELLAKSQGVPVTVTPSPPPGIAEAIQRLLSWMLWIGWAVVAAAFVVGAIYIVIGDGERGRKYLFGAIVGAIVMAFYSTIISGLIG